MADDSIYKALNSISWQLKRIADVLEKKDQKNVKSNLDLTPPKDLGPHSSKLKQLIAQLNQE